MNTLYSHIGVLAALSITVSVLLGWVFLWRYRSNRHGKTLSDPQVTRLLVNLLIFAVISMAVFVFLLIGKVDSWHFFYH